MSSTFVDLGQWSDVARDLGLDHPELLRAPRARKLSEEAQHIHELRRSALSRVADLETLLDTARIHYDLATVAGLDVLAEMHAELEQQSAALMTAVSGLQRSLGSHRPEPQQVGADSSDEPISREGLIARFRLEDQFEGLLDMLTMQGLYNPRQRIVQVQGRGRSPATPIPSFDQVAELLLTDKVVGYLADLDSIQLVLTPVADERVIKGIGRIIGFSDYTMANSSDRSGVKKFVDQIATTDGRPIVDQLLGKTPIPGLAVGLYAEDHNATAGKVEGSGLSLEETNDQVSRSVAEAEVAGVIARPMSPPEYMMLQALRHREGVPLFDEADTSGSGTETWFPAYRLVSAPGTLVSRKMGNSVRFRLDDLGRGSENRGYRMTYAPAA